jgi:hypothetical protein
VTGDTCNPRETEVYGSRLAAPQGQAFLNKGHGIFPAPDGCCVGPFKMRETDLGQGSFLGSLVTTMLQDPHPGYTENRQVNPRRH